MRKLLAALTTLALILPAGAQVPPIQPPPGMLPDGSNAQMPGTATNLSKWTTQIHQNGQTGECYGTGSGRVVCTSDQNYDLIADHSTIQTQDASMITYATVGGSKTAGDVVGFNWTVASTLYQIRYTVQSGDTLATITSNLAACIVAGGATNCTVTAGFLNTLLAFHDANGFGYMPRATAVGTKILFDQPWAASGNSVVTYLSGGATETLTLTGGNILDNGPIFGLNRWVPGWTPTAGSQLGSFYFWGQSTASTGFYDTTYGLISTRVLVQDATNPQGEMLLSTSDSTSGKGPLTKEYIGNGVTFADSTGTNCGYNGLGGVKVCGTLGVVGAFFGSNNVQTSGTSGGFQAIDRTTSGSLTIYRTGGVSSLYDSASGVNELSWDGGVEIGAPTGGLKGVGTLNLAGAIYDNGTAPTGTAGSGYVRATSPTLTTPTLGAATATTIAGQKELQVTKTGNYSVLSSDSNTDFDNTGAAGEVDFTLPAYAVGLRYCFTVTAAQTLKVIAPASNKIAIGTTNSAAAGNITASAVYSTACLYATTASNQWAAKSTTGSWTVN